MGRCALRWRSYRASALCGIAVLNITFLVFLHTHRPSADVSPVELNIVGLRHAEERQWDSAESSPDRTRRFAASIRSPGLKSPGQLRRSNGMAAVNGDFCSNLTHDNVGIPSSADEMTEETFQWQTVGRESRETFVFSAYYDRRTTPAVVRIIGISSGKYVGAPDDGRRQTKHCQLWLPNEIHPKVTLAEYNIVPETHDRR